MRPNITAPNAEIIDAGRMIVMPWRHPSATGLLEKLNAEKALGPEPASCSAARSTLASGN